MIVIYMIRSSRYNRNVKAGAGIEPALKVLQTDALTNYAIQPYWGFHRTLLILYHLGILPRSVIGL